METWKYEKKIFAVMVNNSTNINRSNNFISPQITEYKKEHMMLEIQVLVSCYNIVRGLTLFINGSAGTIKIQLSWLVGWSIATSKQISPSFHQKMLSLWYGRNSAFLALTINYSHYCHYIILYLCTNLETLFWSFVCFW